MIIFLSLALHFAKGQDIDVDELLGDIEEVEETQLLPEKMLFTQRAFWGQNGLYRKIGIAPKVLTAESRENELKARRVMFRVHQITGLLTAGWMLAQGILGTNGNWSAASSRTASNRY